MSRVLRLENRRKVCKNTSPPSFAQILHAKISLCTKIMKIEKKEKLNGLESQTHYNVTFTTLESVLIVVLIVLSAICMAYDLIKAVF